MTQAAPYRSARPLPVDALLLDPRNPRLAARDQEGELSQDDLLLALVASSNIYQIAESISSHGFFDSEPLIAVLGEGSRYVVVEGNRRLAALKILRDPATKASLPKKTGTWSKLSRGAAPDHVPVVIVSDRASIVPLLGYRHISGIEPWDPIAQARYIASLVDEEELSLAEVSHLVGRDLTEVRSMYRNHEILRQADEEFGLDVSEAEQQFGIFTAAMGRRKLRAYINAPDPASVSPDYWPLPPEARGDTQTLLGYLFGDKTSDSARVITDSRQLKDLVEVLADESGRGERVLQSTRSLTEALGTVREPADKFLSHLNNAIRALDRAEQVAPPVLDGSSVSAIRDVQQATFRLLKGRVEGTSR